MGRLNTYTCVDVKADSKGVTLGQVDGVSLHNLHFTARRHRRCDRRDEVSGPKVDVLSVMHSCIAYMSKTAGASDLREAHAAVAELIEAAKECKATELGGMACVGSMAPCEHALGVLFAALANIGETK